MTNNQPGFFLTQRLWEQMQADVSARAAEEACGLIAGRGNRSEIVIPVTNILHDPYRFRMDPQEELNAFVLVEQQGWDIIAIYHSHPHGIQTPSLTDHAELTFPGIIYLIWYQDANGWQCRGYLMQSEQKAEEIPVITSTNE
jgi:proteasome lid subunit RPN8/RPN11